MTNPSLRGPVPKELRCVEKIMIPGASYPLYVRCSRTGRFTYAKNLYCRQHFPPNVAQRQHTIDSKSKMKFKQRLHNLKLESLLRKVARSALRIPFDRAILERAIRAYRKAEHV